MTSVSRQSISKYEMGNSTPRGENLFKLASALKFPISFFQSRILKFQWERFSSEAKQLVQINLEICRRFG
ncbi:helix-turn-helix domain-containing protein [Lacticaseibacillus rhamnosus]|uniref:helix-turn-helix domain-containing protein n=1 Tax=Lacticaseibacillus rhamnosus TaxID=47715 RepID=UPI0021E69FBF|nr:helix-turn-helix transcriptional regulator [Lacticaseibacillus rhamnosus]